MIRESIVITTDKKNKAHVAPMGVILKKKIYLYHHLFLHRLI